MKNNKTTKLDKTSLLRAVYRTLITSGRTYAAFNKGKIFKYVKELAEKKKIKEILDPMAGYGSLMGYCSELNISSYNLEVNAALYLWQFLCNPQNSGKLIKIVSKLLKEKNKWPKSGIIIDVSDAWFSLEGQKILANLFLVMKRAASNYSNNEVEKLALSLLIPFSGRLSSTVPGSVPHVKKGGLIVFKDYRADLENYLLSILIRLSLIHKYAKSKRHRVYFGDCRNFKFPSKRFSACITSPPYPNHRDFTFIFKPEIELMNFFYKNKIIQFEPNDTFAIGTNTVSGIKKQKVKSKKAKRFIDMLANFKDPKRPKAAYDNEVYYIPYFTNYFSDIERAYENLMPALRDSFEGYINVVNNTARDQVIPLAEIIQEIWITNHFKTKVVEKEEKFHIGTKNPRARGFKAKHTEYVIKIWRN